MLGESIGSGGGTSKVHVSCCLTRSSSVYIGTTTDAPKPGRSLLQDYMYIPMY